MQHSTLATQCPFATSSRAAVRRQCTRGALHLRASGLPLLPEGARVRVKHALPVYHVPKLPNIDLKGVEGTVDKIVTVFKGKTLSANLPYKVAFVVKKEDGSQVKFFAHMSDDDVELVA